MNLLLSLGWLWASALAAPYVDLSYDEMYDAMFALAAEVPEFVRVFSANEAFGLCRLRRIMEFEFAPASRQHFVKNPFSIPDSHVLAIPSVASYRERGASRERSSLQFHPGDVRSTHLEGAPFLGRTWWGRAA